MDPNIRKAAATLAISAVAFAGILTREGFEPAAMIPVPEDRPTYGYGSTFRPDGSPVKMGDTITRTAARELAQRDVKSKYEAGIKACAGGIVMYQHEYDSLVDLAYNMGTATVCKSGIVRKFRAGDYAGGCGVIKQYKFVQGRDCTLPQNKHFCGGIPKDRERVFKMCMGVGQ